MNEEQSKKYMRDRHLLEYQPCTSRRDGQTEGGNSESWSLPVFKQAVWVNCGPNKAQFNRCEMVNLKDGVSALIWLNVDQPVCFD